MVTKFILENMHDSYEGPTAVMTFKILHILKQKGRRPVVVDDLRQIIEKSALRIAQEAVGLA